MHCNKTMAPQQCFLRACTPLSHIEHEVLVYGWKKNQLVFFFFFLIFQCLCRHNQVHHALSPKQNMEEVSRCSLCAGNCERMSDSALNLSTALIKLMLRIEIQSRQTKRPLPPPPLVFRRKKYLVEHFLTARSGWICHNEWIKERWWASKLNRRTHKEGRGKD